jgi:hypothetical protein
VLSEGDAAVSQADAFAFEKPPLHGSERFAHGNAAAGGEDTMPGDGLPARAGGHRAARGTSPSGQARGSRQLSVGHDAALGNALDQDVDAAPAFGHAQKDNVNGGDLPVLPPSETEQAEQNIVPASNNQGKKGPNAPSFQVDFSRRADDARKGAFSAGVAGGKNRRARGARRPRTARGEEGMEKIDGVHLKKRGDGERARESAH